MGMWTKAVSRAQTLRTLDPATVTTTPAPITAAPVTDNMGAYQAVILQSDAGNGSALIYIGDSTDTTSRGISLAAGEKLSIPNWDPYKLWAVASTGSLTLRIAII